MTRFRFAGRYALRHLVISSFVAAMSAFVVFGLWYPMPYRQMLGVTGIYLLVLAVDVVCGPLLTLIVASPKKSLRERMLDFGLIGLVQILALAYGMHSVWVARPAVLGFEVDRLVVVTANEIDGDSLPKAPKGFQALPAWGVMEVATRRAASNADFFQNVELGLAGISPAMRPNLWVPMSEQAHEMAQRTKPLAELIARRPEAAELLREAAKKTGHDMDNLTYLPLTSSKNKDWVALLDRGVRMVGYAPVDGF
ncbi:hypothetical protein [Ottowia sp. SB7-C50]|uniref:hypothetical protein n=1 Tax=Ottowia sp. SB7-C50 TaxID=3081231 RepID=UPI002955445E|nr:hypothetical protein [Ottowia sp. SB7-C50]WOP15635.1 hypothetical protein R0D99_00700 [Ottowia sp. SB7-C50]